ASTNVLVGGVPLTRATGDGLAEDSPDASKLWQGTPGLIAGSATCQQFVGKTAAALGQVNYSVSGGKIAKSINPGTFVYYAAITTTAPNQIVTVSQSNTSSNSAAPFGVLQGQALLWSGDCSKKVLVGTVSGTNDSVAAYAIPVAGSYVIAVKYQTK